MSETSHSDILSGSAAWGRITDGIDPGIVDPLVRRRLHDEAQVFLVLVSELQRALDEIQRLHLRIDRRGSAHDELKDKLFDPDEGSFAKLRAYIDQKFGKFTAPLFALLGSVMAGLIMLAATRLTGG